MSSQDPKDYDTDYLEEMKRKFPELFEDELVDDRQVIVSTNGTGDLKPVDETYSTYVTEVIFKDTNDNGYYNDVEPIESSSNEHLEVNYNDQELTKDQEDSLEGMKYKNIVLAEFHTNDKKLSIDDLVKSTNLSKSTILEITNVFQEQKIISKHVFRGKAFYKLSRK